MVIHKRVWVMLLTAMMLFSVAADAGRFIA